MGSLKIGSSNMWVVLATILMGFCMVCHGGNFYQDFDLTWGGNRAKIFGKGQLLSLSLDRVSGSGFQSKKEYLFGRIDMQLKLVAGNSAGTVTAYYVCILHFYLPSYYYILKQNYTLNPRSWTGLLSHSLLTFKVRDIYTRKGLWGFSCD